MIKHNRHHSGLSQLEHMQKASRQPNNSSAVHAKLPFLFDSTVTGNRMTLQNSVDDRIKTLNNSPDDDDFRGVKVTDFSQVGSP